MKEIIIQYIEEGCRKLLKSKDPIELEMGRLILEKKEELISLIRRQVSIFSRLERITEEEVEEVLKNVSGLIEG